MTPARNPPRDTTPRVPVVLAGTLAIIAGGVALAGLQGPVTAPKLSLVALVVAVALVAAYRDGFRAT